LIQQIHNCYQNPQLILDKERQNQEAPSGLENTISETNGSKTAAKNKKEDTAEAVTS